ncbi:MAG: MarR family winged helix-turn-helix transcriptional regulator [Gemmatimonadetes bacterium]|nr:MarR family winged helix-turn-helix transcriptional regulator [Gemmatimonadota bacterium]
MEGFDTVRHAHRRIELACRIRQVQDSGASGRISAHQASVLSHLDREDPTMVGELADHLGVTPSTMSLTLKRMEAAGYVRRDRDPSDRRVMNVRLTDAGVRVRNARSVLDPERVAAMLALLGAEDRVDALRGLRLLAGAADALIRRTRSVVEAQLSGEVL